MNQLSNSHSKIRLSISTVFAGLVLALFISILNRTDQSNAAPVQGFSAGKIMDDSKFVDAKSMDVAQIKSFLSSKTPNCDTWGTQKSEFGGGTRAQWGAARGTPAPFTCLKDYIENGKSSAQIIYDTAQEFQINPQVLLVLLQKEQGLVTDTWPLAVQFRSATGYGCPDTAACDSQYYGLTNQLRWAARMFRSIMNNAPGWYTPYVLGNNYIQYNPNSACGGSNVNIQNRSTQALYNYTPYQPNQGALAAGWGTADCGAYGNRNFYLYFTDWFGSPLKTSLPACTAQNLDCVYGFINEDTGQSFYTSSTNERDQVYKGNYTYTGMPFNTRKSSASNALKVSRLYNTKENFHLWTASSQERTSLLASGVWSDEGVKFYMDPLESNTGLAVKRLYTRNGSGRHVFTSNATEITNLTKTGFSNEGSVFKTPSTTVNTPVPAIGKNNVYRFFFGNKHFWTTSLNERDQLIKAGFNYEGVSWETPIAGSIAVYRVYSPAGYHFWTTKLNEKQTLVRQGWRDEGVSWQSSASGQPTYRLYNTLTGVHIFTTSIPEYTTLKNINYWRDEGIAWYQ